MTAEEILKEFIATTNTDALVYATRESEGRGWNGPIVTRTIDLLTAAEGPFDPPPAQTHLANCLRALYHEYLMNGRVLTGDPMCVVRAAVLLKSLGYDVDSYPKPTELHAVTVFSTVATREKAACPRSLPGHACGECDQCMANEGACK